VPYVIIIHNARCRVKIAAGYSSGFRLCLWVIHKGVSRGNFYTIRVGKPDGKLPIWKLMRWWVRILQQFIQNYYVRVWVELRPFALKFQIFFFLFKPGSFLVHGAGTALWAERSGVWIPERAREFSFLQSVQTDSGSRRSLLFDGYPVFPRG